jgi:intracellular multiplication protein IcmK
VVAPAAGVPTTAPDPAADNRRAFDDLKKDTAPLSPDQIIDLAKALNEGLRAAQHPYGSAPAITNQAKTLNIAPGADGTDLALAIGYPTIITFLDATGEPWPVVAASIGGEKTAFDLQVLPEKGSGPMVQVTPTAPYPMPVGLTVILAGLTKPLVFRLTTGEKAYVNVSFEARVPLKGPNAKPPLIDTPRSLVAGDALLQAVLDGVVPSGAVRIKVDGLTDSQPATEAWLIAASLYLRTPLSLLSPAPRQIIHSDPDGLTAYQLPKTTVVVLSDAGTPIRVRLHEPDQNGITATTRRPDHGQ